MSSGTRFFKAFGPLLFGRRPKSAIAKLQRVDSLQELYALSGELVPANFLSPTEKGSNSRVRLLSAETIFWAFLAQVLQPRCACRDIVRKLVVRKLEAWWRWARCTARSRRCPPAPASLSGLPRAYWSLRGSGITWKLA